MVKTNTAPKIQLLEAEYIASQLVFMLTGLATKIQVAGSVRRKVPEVKDIEIVCLPLYREVPVGLFGDIERQNKVINWLSDASNDMITIEKGGDRYQKFTFNGYKVDLFMPLPQEYGRILAIRTGPDIYSKRLAKRWVELGYEGVDGRLINKSTGKADLEFPTEESFFEFLSWHYQKPTARI